MTGKTLNWYSIRIGMLAVVFGAFALWLRPSILFATTPANLDWPNYGNDLANTRYQNVDQINRRNVKNLRPAWVFHTRTTVKSSDGNDVLDPLAELQVSPIVVNGTMFVTDGHSNVFALNAATGEELWSYKPT